MNKPPDSIPPTPLPFLGVLSISGPDALGFLQGQLSSDVRLLADGRTQLAALNTPQGRVVALLRLRLVDGTVHALLPTELLEPVHSLLRRFVLRSKVQLRIADELQVVWTGPDGGESGRREGTPASSPVPDTPAGTVIAFHYARRRWVVAMPAEAAAALTDVAPIAAGRHVQEEWLAMDIADGLPQVFAETSGAFVPQMLNLDLLDAISFTKGCYTGQEIVARTQHLGRIKRRLLGYRLPPGAAPAPQAGLYRDGTKVAEILLSSARGDGVRLLAVTSLEARGSQLLAEDGRTAEPVELPYPVAGTVSG